MASTALCDSMADILAVVANEGRVRTRAEEREYHKWCIEDCLRTLAREPWNDAFRDILVHHRQQFVKFGGSPLERFVTCAAPKAEAA